MEDGAVYEGRIFVSKNASKTAISGTQKAEGLTASNGAGAALFLAPADSSASIKNALYSGNKASGATVAMGGAVYSNGSPIYFENTVFDGNSAAITAPLKIQMLLQEVPFKLKVPLTLSSRMLSSRTTLPL